MARFRFKIIDSQGRRRSGILRADSLEVAESALRSKLCQVEELTPLADDGQAVEIAGLEGSFSQLDLIRRGLAVLLACIFSLSLYFWLTGVEEPRATLPVSADVSPFRVSGSLDLRAVGNDPSEWKVYLLFPELPYEIGGELQEGTEGDFAFPLELASSSWPQQMVLEVKRDGQRFRLPFERVVSTAGDVDLGRIVVTLPADEKAQESSGRSQPTASAAKDEPLGRGRPLTKEHMRKAIEAQNRPGRTGRRS